MLSTSPRFTEAVEAVSGNGIPSTSSHGLVVIPAKGFGKMLLIGTMFTDACCGDTASPSSLLTDRAFGLPNGAGLNGVPGGPGKF